MNEHPVYDGSFPWFDGMLRAAQAGERVALNPTDPLTILIWVLGVGFGYLFLAGLTSALTPDDRYWRGDDYHKVVGGLWPITWVCWVVYQVVTAGPRIVDGFRYWRNQRRLPKAQVVQKS